MTKAKFLLYSCLSFVAGIFVNSFVDVSWLLWPGLFLYLFGLVLSWRKRKVFALCLLFLFFLAGVWRHQLEENRIFLSELRKLNDSGQSIVLTGVVADDPTQKASSQQFSLRIQDTVFKGEKLLVFAEKYPAYHYGDKLRVVGKLRSPQVFEGFDYPGYLQKERIYSQMLFPQTEVWQKAQGNPVQAVLFGFKDRFRQAWQRFLSPPQLGLFEALIFGEEENISSAWKEKMNLSGTRHLAAVSGMNITIVSSLLVGLLLALGFWRQSAILGSLFLVWLFIIMIGAPASALRAGLMASFFLAARLSGRPSVGERALVFSGAALLAENPLLLKSDTGFQLSFLAMIGLVFWQPFFQEKVFRRLGSFLRTNLSVAFAAQVFTFPLLLYSFGYISLVFPLTNLLLVPLVPYLTMAGLGFGILGMLFFPLGQVLAWLLWPGLSFLLLTIDLSVRVPFSHLAFPPLSWPVLAVVFLFLTYLTWHLRRRQALQPVVL